MEAVSVRGSISGGGMRARGVRIAQRAAWVIVAGVAAGCAPPGRLRPAPQSPPAPEGTATYWMRHSAEYVGLVHQAYTVAQSRLAELSRGLAPGRWGVILDADETVLDNRAYEARRVRLDSAFTDASWAAWVREEAAPALPGAVRFTTAVHALGGRVVIVTNRADSSCDATRATLRHDGVAADLVLCQPPHTPDKNPRFESVERGTASTGLPPLRIVEWLGDNIQDFPHLTQASRTDTAALAHFGRDWFLMPNPAYGSWAESLDRAGRSAGPSVTVQSSGTDEGLIAVSPVDARVAWVAGRTGTYAVTTDGGAHWRPGTVPGAEALQFRDVHATDSLTAWLLSIGPADSSRIYHTTDGGRHWALQFVNRDPAAFYDCFAFRDARHAIAVGDAVRGRIPILLTADGGAHWRMPAPESRPAADSGEGSLAASGTCVAVGPGHRAWIATSGGRAGARVLASDDGGRRWRASVTPLGGRSPRAALASIAFRDALHGYAAGGDSLGAPVGEVARTDDGGRSWRMVGPPTVESPVYGIAAVPGKAEAVVAVGPGGASYSGDGGASWAPLDDANYWGVAFARRRARPAPAVGWMVGAHGRIARLTWR